MRGYAYIFHQITQSAFEIPLFPLHSPKELHFAFLKKIITGINTFFTFPSSWKIKEVRKEVDCNSLSSYLISFFSYHIQISAGEKKLHFEGSIQF